MEHDLLRDELGFITVDQTAGALGVSARTLLNWDQRGIGPTRYRLSTRCVRYKSREVLSWVSTRGAA